MQKTTQHYLNIMQHAPYCILPAGENKPIIRGPILFDTIKEATHWLQAQEHSYYYVICDNQGNAL